MRKELTLKTSLKVLSPKITFFMAICITTAALADVPQIAQGTNVLMQGSAERERRQKIRSDSSLYFLVGMNPANDKHRTFSDNAGLLSYFQSLPTDVQMHGLWIKRMARTLWTQADADQLSDIAKNAKLSNLKMFTCEPKEPKNGSWLVTWDCSQVSPQSGMLSVNCEATESKGQAAKWNCKEKPWGYTNPGPMTQEEIARAAQEKLRSRQEKARNDLAILDKKISEKVIGEYKLEVPGNYLLLESFTLPDSLRFSVFLKDYGGWTNERISWWGEKDGTLWGKSRLAVDVWLSKNVAHEKKIQEVISIALPTTKVFGLDAYINDYGKTGIKLPVNYSEYTTSVHYVFVGKNEGDRLYMICYAPTPDKKPISGCELYVSSKKGLLIHTWLNESIAPDWLKIGNQINKLINSWIVNPKRA